MKPFIFTKFLLATLLTSTTAIASQGRGGGDMCEDQIKIIRDDFVPWIRKGGPANLVLPASISVSDYSKRMLSAIASTKVACVGPNDPGYPILVDGMPKVCRFDVDTHGSRITCDISKIASLPIDILYVLIHHEYAGVADIEPANGSDSNYQISNQITGFLESQVVKKLVVAPRPAKMLQPLTRWEKGTFVNAEAAFKSYSKVLKLAGRSIEDFTVESSYGLGKVTEISFTHTSTRRYDCPSRNFEIKVSKVEALEQTVMDRLEILQIEREQLFDAEIVMDHSSSYIHRVKLHYCKP